MKNGLLFLLFFFVHGVYATGIAKLDSIENELISENIDSQVFFNKCDLLWNEALKLRKTNSLVNIPARYRIYINQSILWAERMGTDQQVIQAKLNLITFERKTAHYANSIDIALKLLESKLPLTTEDKILLYNALSMNYAAIGYYYGQLELIPDKYKLLRQHYSENEIKLKLENELGGIYYNLQEYNKAIASYKMVIAYTPKEKRNNNKVCSMYNNIGLAFKNNIDSSTYYFKKAISILDKSTFGGDDLIFAQRYKEHFRNIIKTNLAKANPREYTEQETITLLKKEIESGIITGERNIYIKDWYELGERYYNLEEYELSLSYLNKVCDELSESTEMRKTYLKSIRLKSRTLLIKNDIKAAEVLFEEVKKLENELLLLQNKNVSQTIAIIRKTNKMEQEIQVHNSNISKKNTLLERKKRNELIFIITSIFLFALLLVSYLLIRKLRRANKIIEDKSIEINKALEQRNILLKEIHHRVKNNLQLISNLLNKFGKQSNQEDVRNYLLELEGRIKTIGVIHHKLYQSDDFKFVDMKAYLTELVNNVTSFYTEKSKSSKVDLILDEVELQIELAMPVGLIMHELITNAFKYGYQKDKHLDIVVAFVRLSNKSFVIQVSDNGQGLKGTLEENLDSSLGLNLIKGLVWQIHGKFEYHYDDEAIFTIQFKDLPNK